MPNLTNLIKLLLELADPGSKLILNVSEDALHGLFNLVGGLTGCLILLELFGQVLVFLELLELRYKHSLLIIESLCSLLKLGNLCFVMLENFVHGYALVGKQIVHPFLDCQKVCILF